MGITHVFGLFICQWPVVAFWASLPRRETNSCGVGFLMAPLSNEEIFARTQQSKLGQQDDIPLPPKIFEDDMLDDMQAALLLLEKRVQEGPLTVSEVDQLTSQLDKIQYEMKQNKHKKPPRPSTSSTHSTSTVQPAQVNAAAPLVIDMDTPSDEGAPYDGRGGMGQAANTANTYVIPGMEEMTADEYQAALEQTIIERQRQRRYGGGPTGNRSTWNYLNSLTGESGILKKDEK